MLKTAEEASLSPRAKAILQRGAEGMSDYLRAQGKAKAALPAVPLGGQAAGRARPQNCGTGYCSCIECPYGGAGRAFECFHCNAALQAGQSCPDCTDDAGRAMVPLNERQLVACLLQSNCIGTVKMSFESGPYEIDRPSINADRLCRAIEAASAKLNGLTVGDGGAKP